MVKSTKEKKIILGSALAGLILAGPGLSVTATPTSGKFFQTAQLSAGYRLAQAETKKEDKVVAAATATPAPSPAPKDASKHCSGDKAKDDKHCSGDKAKSGDMKCGAGSCGGTK